jgi:hypothetical protein
MTRPRTLETVRIAVIALFFLAAPTAGDIGSCNQPEDDLDATKFFSQKQAIDCRRCLECEINTQACRTACGALQGGSFPEGCFPVIHDGEVCLNALEAATCAVYRGYVADQGSTVPTECDFCPLRVDAGAP